MSKFLEVPTTKLIFLIIQRVKVLSVDGDGGDNFWIAEMFIFHAF
jgi:hypothetical protein